MALTTAQLRAYQQICDPESGRMLVIAMDQRASMRQLIQVPGGAEATADDLVAAKLDLVAHLGNAAPAVLLDPSTVVPQVVDNGILARDCALMVGSAAVPAHRLCRPTGCAGRFDVVPHHVQTVETRIDRACRSSCGHGPTASPVRGSSRSSIGVLAGPDVVTHHG